MSKKKNFNLIKRRERDDDRVMSYEQKAEKRSQ